MASATKMRAVQVSKAGGTYEVVERDIPEPGPGWVRIKVEACGVCHSDMVLRVGAIPGTVYPRIPGHELAGRIDKVGENVVPWKVGDRAGAGWHGGHCFVCHSCRKGLFINCEQAKVTGLSHDGGYAEYALVRQEAVVRLPEGLDAASIGPLLCAGVTTYNSLRNSGARAGDTVAVQGIGGLGHLGIQYAARMGCRTIALSHGADKAALARELGAHEYVDTSAGSAAEGLKRLGGADYVLATAPHGSAITDTIGGLKPRGKLVLVAAPSDALTHSAYPLLSGKSIMGWPSGSAIDSEETVAFSVLAQVRPVIETFKLEQAEEALTKVLANKIRFRAVLTP